jgi:hypothetical protein
MLTTPAEENVSPKKQTTTGTPTLNKYNKIWYLL